MRKRPFLVYPVCQIFGTNFIGSYTVMMVYKISPNNLKNVIGKIIWMIIGGLVRTISKVLHKSMNTQRSVIAHGLTIAQG